MTNHEYALKQLTNTIASLFQDGFECSRDAWHFIQSTAADASYTGLAALLNDDEESDAETILEFIFFPENHHQELLEPILEQNNFKPEDEQKILACFSPPPPVHFMLPDEMGTIEFAPPKWALEQFIARLKIFVHTDERLLTCLERWQEPLFQTRMKVLFRNARFDPSEKTIRFLVNFLKQTDAEGEALLEILAFLLGFLENLPTDRPIYTALTDRKKSCFKALAQAGKQSEQMEKHNMETLLLQGFRMPHIDIEQNRKMMVIIDHVCYTVFGRTEILEPVREMSETADISDIVRRLTD